jgi:hypothetical protein
MKKKMWSDFNYMEEDIANWMPEQVSCVIVDREYIPIDNVEFLNVEEYIDGRDLVTFKYGGKERKSHVVIKYL